MKSFINFKKTEAIEKLIEKLILERDLVQSAVQAAHEASTHEESKAEDSHDTRAIEASYLTAGQSKRLSELNRILIQLQVFLREKQKRSESIQLGSLIVLQEGPKQSVYFIHSEGGGISATLQNHTVQILTPHSILGEEILGLKIGDQIEFETNNQSRTIKVLQIDSD